MTKKTIYPKPMDEQMHIYFKSSQANWLRRQSELKAISVSAVVRLLVDAEMKRGEKPQNNTIGGDN